ncbi:hypothetical protein MKY20_11350 [Cytobacillus sp. FSL W8-0315]|uniref:hypothetical protein n=1 Tax=Cytobacillus sp. FSL W8-0315 TaxID=2921600 RepID=UPI0030FA846D
MELTVKEYLSLKEQGVSDSELLRMFHYSENSGMMLYYWKKKNGLLNKYGKKDMPKKTDVLDEHIEEINQMRLSNYTTKEIAFKFGVKRSSYEYWVKKKKEEGLLNSIPRAKKRTTQLRKYAAELSDNREASFHPGSIKGMVSRKRQDALNDVRRSLMNN